MFYRDYRFFKSDAGTIIIFIFLFTSCSTTVFKKHLDADNKINKIKKYLLITPDINIYEFTAGGMHELRDDWSEQSVKFTKESLRNEFSSIASNLKEISIDKTDNDLRNLSALYEAVSRSINQHVLGPEGMRFPEKSKNFVYSIGSTEKLLKEHDADALVFVYGFDEVSTGGRAALGMLGVMTGVLTGVYVMPRGGITFVSIAVIDREGNVLWYGTRGGESKYDLRKEKTVQTIVKNILKDYPGLKK